MHLEKGWASNLMEQVTRPARELLWHPSNSLVLHSEALPKDTYFVMVGEQFGNGASVDQTMRLTYPKGLLPLRGC